jgi:hypothetical protein
MTDTWTQTQVQPLIDDGLLDDNESERGMPFHAMQLSRCARLVRTQAQYNEVAQALHKNP